MKSLSSFTFILLIQIAAYATNKVGNGGNVVVCKNETTSSQQVLDFYENEVTEPSSITKTNLEIAQEQVDKLKEVAPELHKQYNLRLKSILSEFDYKKDVRLMDVKDSLHAFTPASKDCNVIQTIIRKETVTSDEKRFLVDKGTWEKLNAFQQAGLIMHEMIYEHFYRLGEKNSVKARKLNAFLFKTTLTKKTFWEYIKDLDVPIYP
jgi:hypothetical protein